MTNHILIKISDMEYVAQGIGAYFWWDIFFECDEWIVSSIWGRVYKRTETLDSALSWIESNN